MASSFQLPSMGQTPLPEGCLASLAPVDRQQARAN